MIRRRSKNMIPQSRSSRFNGSRYNMKGARVVLLSRRAELLPRSPDDIIVTLSHNGTRLTCTLALTSKVLVIINPKHTYNRMN